MVAVIAPQTFYVLSHSRNLHLDFPLQEYCTFLPLCLAKCWSSRLAHLKPTSSVKSFLTSPHHEISFLGGQTLYSPHALLIWPEAVLLMIYSHVIQEVSPDGLQISRKVHFICFFCPLWLPAWDRAEHTEGAQYIFINFVKKSGSEHNDNEEWKVGEENPFSSKKRLFL